MGSILHAKCSCGFSSLKDLDVGCGMAKESCFIPVACPQCRNIWTTKETYKKYPCRKCNSQLIDYTDPTNYFPPEIYEQLKGDFPFLMNYIPSDEPYEDDKPMPNMKYKCPSCGKMEMEFVFGGCWD